MKIVSEIIADTIAPAPSYPASVEAPKILHDMVVKDNTCVVVEQGLDVKQDAESIARRQWAADLIRDISNHQASIDWGGTPEKRVMEFLRRHAAVIDWLFLLLYFGTGYFLTRWY